MNLYSVSIDINGADPTTPTIHAHGFPSPPPAQDFAKAMTKALHRHYRGANITSATTRVTVCGAWGRSRDDRPLRCHRPPHADPHHEDPTGRAWNNPPISARDEDDAALVARLNEIRAEFEQGVADIARILRNSVCGADVDRQPCVRPTGHDGPHNYRWPSGLPSGDQDGPTTQEFADTVLGRDVPATEPMHLHHPEGDGITVCGRSAWTRPATTEEADADCPECLPAFEETP